MPDTTPRLAKPRPSEPPHMHMTRIITQASLAQTCAACRGQLDRPPGARQPAPWPRPASQPSASTAALVMMWQNKLRLKKLKEHSQFAGRKVEERTFAILVTCSDFRPNIRQRQRNSRTVNAERGSFQRMVRTCARRAQGAGGRARAVGRGCSAGQSWARCASASARRGGHGAAPLVARTCPARARAGARAGAERCTQAGKEEDRLSA